MKSSNFGAMLKGCPTSVGFVFPILDEDDEDDNCWYFFYLMLEIMDEKNDKKQLPPYAKEIYEFWLYTFWPDSYIDEPLQ